MGILLHDIGMLSQRPEDLAPEDAGTRSLEDVPAWVRNTHITRLERLTERLFGATPFAFATFHWTDDSESAVNNSLGWLAFQLPRKLGQSGTDDLLHWIKRVVDMNSLRAFPLALHGCIVLASSASNNVRQSSISTARSILLALRIAANDQLNGSYELAKALNYVAYDLSKKSGELIDWASPNGTRALNEILSIIRQATHYVVRLPDPIVRAQVAFLLVNLTRWYTDREMTELLQLFLSDPRARVRFAARGGWEAVSSASDDESKRPS
jgi:hypothetical protein